MNTNDKNLIFGLPRRPRGENQTAGAAIGALLGLVFTENPGGAILGGIAGSALTNQPLNLEAAVRNYFLQQNLPVVSVCRSPGSIEVLFKIGNQFWTVKSGLPDSLSLEKEDIEDWLYGNLVKNELPRKLKQIKRKLTV